MRTQLSMFECMIWIYRDLGEMHIDRVSNLTEEEISKNKQRISKLDISGE